MLRQEVFAEDGSARASVPYSVGERSFAVRLEQPRAGQRHAVFFVHEREALTYHYERVVDDPRLQQSATLEVDAFGNVLRSVAVAYPRRLPAHAEQGQTSVVCSEALVANQTAEGGPYRLGVPVEARSYELTNQAADPVAPWTWEALTTALDAATVVPFEAEVLPTDEVRRTLGVQRSLYYTDDLTGALPLGQPGVRALPYESRAAAFSAAQATAVFGAAVDATMLEIDGGYVLQEGLWWTRSPRQIFDPTQFYLPTSALDPFGNETTITYDADALMVTQVTDPVGNAVQAQHDYRVLAPSRLTDPNGNRIAAGYDGLGQLGRTAVLGKMGDTGMDSLAEPTSLLAYDLWAWHDGGTPVWMRTQTRELHGADPGRWLESYAYADGRGGTVMAKAKAQPGTEVYDGVLPDPVERWVGNGRTIRNNKGLPVRQYEPFFSTTSAFEGEAEIVEHGVTPVLYYDPLGRLVRTELPNGTQARVEFSPWEQRSYDPNDEVLGSAWYAERIALSSGDPERRAAELAGAHAGTPTVTHLDHLGRAFLAVVHTRDSSGDDVYYETRARLDVQGNVLWITDANGTVAEERIHGMLGQVLQTTSLEVGNRYALSDVLGAPLYATASRGFSTRYRYDQARRPTHTFVTRPDSSSFTATRIVYGEAAASPTATNLRGQVFRIYDGAGLQVHEQFDVDGNLVRQSRCLAAAYDTTPDWSDLDDLDDPADMDTATAALLETEVFTTEASFDAMGRPVTKTSPDASVLHLGYGDAGHLETVAANVRGDVTETSFVTDLRYDARGQRTLVVYGNGTQTSYAYDPLTFRLEQVQTLRVSDDHPHQDLRYTFDPVGNITEIRDLAQPVVFTSNAAVSAGQRFVYDALYRLVQAEGREHESQGQPVSDDFTSRAAPEDPTGLRLYTEQYLHDAVGNILELQHIASGGNWTRRYGYDTETSGNRLLATSAPGDGTGVYSHTYDYDAHGSMTAMPHLAAIGWDFADRMASADLGGGGTVYFTYDAAGQRVRKVRVSLAGNSTWQRIYLGGFELYREHVSAELRLERQTLLVGDDAGRVCLVETKTIEDADTVATPTSICRYQYGNHLGTVGLELDESGLLISYEEFTPYGTTAYRAANSSIEVSPSRYRYTGKERDEETGLGYHGARYYASWLSRWTAADPIGLGDGPNRFAYVGANPIGLHDSGGMRAEPPRRALETGTQLTETEQEQLTAMEVSFGKVEVKSSVGLPKSPKGIVAEAVHRTFAGHAKAEDFSLEAVRKELQDVKGVGNIPTQGEVEVKLRADEALRLAERFGVPLGETQRLFPALSGVIGGTGAIDVPPAVQKGAELAVAAGIVFDLVTARRALTSLLREYGKKKAAQEGAEEVAEAGGREVAEEAAERAATKEGVPQGPLQISPGQLRPTEKLVGRAGATPREHIDAIAESMRTHGWNGPPVSVVRITEDAALNAGLPRTAAGSYIIDGHHRVRAAAKAGIDVVYEEIPFTTAQARHGWTSLKQMFGAWAELP